MGKALESKLVRRTIGQLAIDDEGSFRHVALYADLKEVLRRAEYPFRVLPKTSAGRWDRALLLNLTFWGATEGSDVLTGDELPADVVTHVGWHHLAAKELAPLSADALFLGEAIASAFDVYLVGRLVGHAPKSSFLESHVAQMADAADGAGMDEDDFEALLQSVAANPDRAFEDLRQLLFDATTALVACQGAEEGLGVLESFGEHRFAALLHGYELSNWVLYARAYARDTLAPDPRIRDLDRTLRAEGGGLDWLTAKWVRPALA